MFAKARERVEDWIVAWTLDMTTRWKSFSRLSWWLGACSGYVTCDRSWQVSVPVVVATVAVVHFAYPKTIRVDDLDGEPDAP